MPTTNPFDPIYCPVCKRPVQPNEKKCLYCDTEIGRETVPRPISTAPKKKVERTGLPMDVCMIAAMVVEMVMALFFFGETSPIADFFLSLVFPMPFVLAFVFWDVWLDNDRFGKPVYLILILSVVYGVLGTIRHGESIFKTPHAGMWLVALIVLHAVIVTGIWRRYGSPTSVYYE